MHLLHFPVSKDFPDFWVSVRFDIRAALLHALLPASTSLAKAAALKQKHRQAFAPRRRVCCCPSGVPE
jgi:hypothetical protein